MAGTIALHDRLYYESGNAQIRSSDTFVSDGSVAVPRLTLFLHFSDTQYDSLVARNSAIEVLSRFGHETLPVPNSLSLSLASPLSPNFLTVGS